jgi:hypothetical protein
MNFVASAETYKPAGSASEVCRRAVEPLLNTLFAQSALSALDCKLRYVPIIMPSDMATRYPARSRLRLKDGIYDCAPQLGYETFVNGTFEQQLTAYVDGIRSSAPHLAKLGASQAQIAEFEQILNRAVERALANELDQTRH